MTSSASRRARVRAATIEEIKTTALALMRESGTADVRFVDIARAMGMTAPALYRYFADRDALLTALIVDGFEDFGATLRDALAAAGDDVPSRVLAVAQAYRRWATGDPQRFALVFGLPVPGFTGLSEGPVLQATRAAMGNFQEIVRGHRLRPMIPEVAPTLAKEIGRMAAAHREAAPADAPGSDDIPDEGYQALLHAWTAIHGFACLEAFGYLDWLSGPAREDLFRSQAQVLATAMGAGRLE